MARESNRKSAQAAGAEDPIDRQPPFSTEAEVGVIGSAFIDPVASDELATRVSEGDFYDPAHRVLFRHIMSARRKGRGIDHTLLLESLKASGEYEAIGGSAYLGKVVNSVHNSAHWRYYADIVREKASRRRLIDGATAIINEAFYSPDDISALTARAEAAMFGVAEKSAEKMTRLPFNDVVLSALDMIDQRQSGKIPKGLTTGFHGVDNATGGMMPGEVTILAGRTSMGKTACALNVAHHVAERADGAVLFFSLEMDASAIAERLLSGVARVDLYRMRAGTLSAKDRQELVEASGKVASLNMAVEDCVSLTLAEMASICRRQKRSKSGLSFVVLDYLQLLQPDNHRDPRHEQVARTSRGIKALARELRVPILCLAQLNRQTTASKDNKPALSHLRESGAIEMDADVVLFTHRPAYYSGQQPARGCGEDAMFLIAKNRQGPTAEVPVLWFGAWTKFANKADDRFNPDNEGRRIVALDDWNAPA